MCEENEGLQSLNSLDCWDYSIELEYLQGTQDLQLAAELGKTLLERNKELENAIKHKESVIEDQRQEIEYLTKQSVALREVNDSRLRIYEQLEVSIQDLERANHRLLLENSAEKKHVKSLTSTIEGLEAKNDELLTSIDELRLQTDVLKKKLQRALEPLCSSSPKEAKSRSRAGDVGVAEDADGTDSKRSQNRSGNSTATPVKKTEKLKTNATPETNTQSNGCSETDNLEELSQLLNQLRESKILCGKEQRRATELEEQLATVVHQNRVLENQIVKLHHKESDGKSIHDELITLDEVRQGNLCSKCLGNSDKNEDVPEDDDSMMEALVPTSQYSSSSFTPDIQEYARDHPSPITKQTKNHYKELIEKYEALFENHQQPPKKNKVLSLHEEMQLSGELNLMIAKDVDEESLELHTQHKKSTRVVSHTPTDFSEAETSSSGFTDETSTKATQTDGKVGAFLCAIADGEDCQFSIYDDASPIDSRFRKRPEYRELFKEIFTVLKKAAENKEDGQELHLLDDFVPVKAPPQVPPVTPATENFPDFIDDDSQSIVSSVVSDISISQTTTVIESFLQAQSEIATNQEAAQPSAESKLEEPVLRPLVREPLDYLTTGSRKRSSSRRKNKFSDRSDSPITHIIGSPKISYSSRPSSGRRRRELKVSPSEQEHNWSGNSLQFWATNRSNIPSPTPSQGSEKTFEFKPSSATQEIRKLKKLDKSYAEVLKLGEGRKSNQRQRKF